MYNKITEINNVFTAFEFYEDGLICNIGNGKEAHVTFFDKNFNKTFQLEHTSYDFFIIHNTLFFTTDPIILEDGRKILKSFKLNLNNKQVEELPYTLHIKGLQHKDRYFCWGNKGFASDDKDSYYFLIDLKTFNIEKQFPESVGLKTEELLTSNFIVFLNSLKGVVGCYDFEMKSLWQIDLSEKTAYTDWKGNHNRVGINKVYEYNNQLVILSGKSVLGINSENGEILWHLKYEGFVPYKLNILNNKGYLNEGVYYSVIDLDKGEKILDMEIPSPFDNLMNYQNHFLLVDSGITLYKDKVYFSSRKDGETYLFCMNPNTGVIEDYQVCLKRPYILQPPRFQGDKMFLLDNNYTLHIYEQDKSSIV